MKDLTHVNGVRVEARERARYTIESRPAVTVNPGTEVPTVDELLLEDGTVVFQCMHPKNEDCDYTHVKIRSVTAHQTAHGVRNDRREAREALARAEAAERELEERKQRRSNGSRQGALTRRQRELTHVPAEVGGRGGDKIRTDSTSSAIGNKELAKMAQNVITAWNALREAENAFQDVMIGYMRAAQVATDVAEAPPIDPKILESAKNWNDLQAMLGKK